MKNTNPVVWFEIYIDDLQRAKKFYEEVFDLQLEDMPSPDLDDLQMLAFPTDMEAKNLASGTLVQMKGMNAGGNSTILCKAVCSSNVLIFSIIC